MKLVYLEAASFFRKAVINFFNSRTYEVWHFSYDIQLSLLDKNIFFPKIGETISYTIKYSLLVEPRTVRLI